MIPGLFSWALSIPLGKRLGATPNGRRAGAPISHGANPNNGFRRDGAPTALAAAVAAVQPGYGNTAPLQIDLDPGLSNTPDDVTNVAALIRGHFDLGGTQVNINVLDEEEAPRGPPGPQPLSRPDRARHRLQRLLRQPLARVPPDGHRPRSGRAGSDVSRGEAEKRGVRRRRRV